MSEPWSSIAINVVSDFLSIAIAVTLGIIFYRWTKRNKLLQFFGISKNRKIIIYLSNLSIEPFGAKGIDRVKRSYEGSAGAYQEFESANRLYRFFTYPLPSLSDKPGLLAKLLIADTDVKILPSPTEKKNLETTAPFICLGSPAYNVASKFCEENLPAKAKFNLGYTRQINTEHNDASFRGLVVNNSASSEVVIARPSGSASAFDQRYLGETIHPFTAERDETSISIEDLEPIKDAPRGFIERLWDKENNRFVFYVAGISEEATAGACNYLKDNWGELHEKYPGKEFLVMLRVDKPDYKKTTVIFEKS